MPDQHDTTIHTYQENFDRYIEKTPQDVKGEFKEWIDKFASLVTPHGRIIELGSAFGRDARYLRDKGFQVLCTDVIPQGLHALAEEGFETEPYDFRNTPSEEWHEAFDGYFASAVLLHAKKDVFVNALSNAQNVLKPQGVGAFSLKQGEGEEVTNEKMEAPRFFQYYSRNELVDILSKLQVEVLSLTEAENGKWLQVIFRKR